MQYYKCSSAILEMDLKPSTLQVYHFGSQSRLQKPQLLLRCAYYCTTAFHFRPFRPTRNKRTGEKGLLKIKTQFKKADRPPIYIFYWTSLN